MAKRNRFPQKLIRKQIEKLGASEQCKAIIGTWQNACAKGECYLCGIQLCERYGRLSFQALSYPSDPRSNINIAPPPQCDHLLPVKEMAAFLCGGAVTKQQILKIQQTYAAITSVKEFTHVRPFTGTYSFQGTGAGAGAGARKFVIGKSSPRSKKKKKRLKLKTVFTILKFLDWAHAPCNLYKSDIRFIQVYENRGGNNISDSYTEIYNLVFDRDTPLKNKATKYDALLKAKGFIKIHDFQWTRYSTSVPPKNWIWLPNLNNMYRYLFRVWNGLNSNNRPNQGQNGGFSYYLRTKFVPFQYNKILRGPVRTRGYHLAQYYNSRFNNLQAMQRWWFEMRSRILIEIFYKVCHYLNTPGAKQFKWRKIWREINNIPCGFKSKKKRK